MLVNGGRGQELPGTWSATIEYLVRRAAPLLPSLAFVEVKYRIRSWHRLDDCVEDAREALERIGDVPVAIVGFSMGGTVATRVADDPRVRVVIGVNPWLPEALDMSPLAGKELRVVHGSLDRPFPGVPGRLPRAVAPRLPPRPIRRRQRRIRHGPRRPARRRAAQLLRSRAASTRAALRLARRPLAAALCRFDRRFFRSRLTRNP